MKKIMIIVLLILAIVAIFLHRSARANEIAQQSTQYHLLTCPKIEDIQKNPTKGNWVANLNTGSWKSYHMSFATDLTHLIGAEWSGENLGTVACVYQSEQKFNLNGQPTIQATLPVILVFHTLVFAPTGGKWQHVRRGYRSCASLERTDCPFKINVTPSASNIFEQAESLKKQPVDSAN